MRNVTLCTISLALFLSGGDAVLAQAPVQGYEVVNRYPHDTSAFTEGLILHDGLIYESTGLYGASSLRKVDLRTGAVVQKTDVAPQYFAEGMTIFAGRVFQLTWQSQTGFIYDPATLAELGRFFYTGEGWGLTHDDRHLIMSDGTNRIRFLDPTTFQTVKSISVDDAQGGPLTNINELEFINGEIYANIWLTDWIVRIDPDSGAIRGWIDLTGLLPVGTAADVLNGIAYDQATGHLLVTGKWWPWLFEIRLTGGSAPPVNTAPVATPDAYSTNVNTALARSSPGVLGNDTDVDGDPLAAVLVSAPVHGALTLNANGSFDYMPPTNYSGQDSFTYSASDGVLVSNATTVSLSISGPIVSLSPTSISFGNQAVGTTSGIRTVTLTNTGTGPLTLSSVSITGTNATDFLQTNSCGASVAPRAACTITLTFRPTTTGARRGTVVIADNAAGSPQTITLSGTGKKERGR